MSAFGAIELAKRDYKFQIEINFIKQSFEDCLHVLKELKQELNKKTVFKFSQFDLPKRLWRQLVLASNILDDTTWADTNKQQLDALALQLTKAIFSVDGKSTFKEEFVTAGGINLKEVNFNAVNWSEVPNQELYSWDNQNESLEKGNYNYYQVLVDNQVDSFFARNPENGYIVQLEVLKNTNTSWNTLFCAIQSIQKEMKTFNVDDRLIDKTRAIEVAGLRNTVNQYEMELLIKA